MEKYRKCGFAHLWAASAFKGATGASQALTPIEHHLRNHVQWLQVATQAPASALQGIVLTGWQRWVPIQAHLVGGVPPHVGQLWTLGSEHRPPRRHVECSGLGSAATVPV